jgi:hypothetical protein
VQRRLPTTVTARSLIAQSLALRSPRAGRVVRLTVTYDRRYQPAGLAPAEQLLGLDAIATVLAVANL